MLAGHVFVVLQIDGDPDIFQDGMYRFVLPVPENLYEFKLPVSFQAALHVALAQWPSTSEGCQYRGKIF